jgi:hypothetical protein
MHTFKKIKIRFISRLPYLKKIKLNKFLLYNSYYYVVYLISWMMLLMLVLIKLYNNDMYSISLIQSICQMIK